MMYADYALIFKALGDSTRTEIVDTLKNGKKCACRLLEAFNITQPTLSYHMKILVDCGLILSEKKGKWNYYTLSDEVMKSLMIFLSKDTKNKKVQNEMCEC